VCRWVGTVCPIILFQWRYAYYPDDYPFVRSPIAIFLFVATEPAELLYPMIFLRLTFQERPKLHVS